MFNNFNPSKIFGKKHFFDLMNRLSHESKYIIIKNVYTLWIKYTLSRVSEETFQTKKVFHNKILQFSQPESAKRIYKKYGFQPTIPFRAIKIFFQKKLKKIGQDLLLTFSFCKFDFKKGSFKNFFLITIIRTDRIGLLA